MSAIGLLFFGLAALLYWDADKRTRRGELSIGQQKAILIILLVQILFGITALLSATQARAALSTQESSAALAGDGKEAGR